MKIISFSSHSATWYFAFAEAVVASELQKKGHDVIYITPGNLFKRISNLKQEKILRREFSLKGYEIGTELASSDFQEISAIIKKLNKDNFEKLEINNIQIGKIALYEFLLNHKKTNLVFTHNEWKECKVYLKNTLISFFACRAIINKESPDRILIYNTLYSINHVWEKYAELKGIPVYFLHNGLNFSDSDNTLIIAKRNSLFFYKKLRNIWPKVKNISASRRSLSYVTDHFLELLKAKHVLVYSAPKSRDPVNIRKIFNIKKEQKIITVAMSSYDETFAAEYVGVRELPKDLIFSNQTVWIKQIINYMKDKQDIFLIIRVHPREFPNRREGVKSDHAKMLENFFKNLPDNIKVNWPIDNISLYDLAQETDVFLSAWSTVGVEMSLLGIPVVIYSKELILYPSDLNYVARDRKDYFIQIESALKEGWSFEKLKKTYRWLVLYYFQTIIRFRSKKAKSKQSVINKLVSNTANYFYRLLSPNIRSFLIKIYMMIPGLGIGKRQIDDCRRQLAEHVDISSVEKMLRESGDTLVDINKALKSRVSDEEEDRFIRHEVKRIYEALYGNLPKGTEIMKNSLQYNLYKTFH